MKVYIVTFNGIQPVGACAVVAATSKALALAAFIRAWNDNYPSTTATSIEIREFDTRYSNVDIVLDGDY